MAATVGGGGRVTDSLDDASDVDARGGHRPRAPAPERAVSPDALSRLAGGIGHEFRNLLMIIQNYAEFIREELPPDSALHGDLAELTEAAGRAARLTDDLVAFGRVGTASTRPVDLERCVAAAQARLRELIPATAELEIEIASGVPAVQADPDRMPQVLEHLVRAVADGLAEHRAISITATERRIDDSAASGVPPGRYVLLEVGDAGREAATDATFGPGAGAPERGHGAIGLAIVHGILDAWGGALHVRTARESGTVLRLLLPCAAEPAAAVAAVAPEGLRSPAAGGGARVLVCEDERAIRTMCERALRGAGFDVIVAEDGDAGIRLLSEEQAAGRRLDLLVSDIVMPGSSGFDVAIAARERYPDVSILLMTAFSEELARRAPPSGTLVLEKPFGAALLVRRARTLAACG
jgi:two-component system cell cycle sensor histidine kinase/response regulator CckA